MSFVLLGILNSQAAGGAGAPTDFDLLETTELSTTTNTITFTNLNNYTDYKHLQLRMVTRTDAVGVASNHYLRFNSDTGTNYYSHRLYANNEVRKQNENAINVMTIRTGAHAGGGVTGVYGVAISDIFDFSSTSKKATMRTFEGRTDADTESEVSFSTQFWNDTSAATSLTIFPSSGDYVSGSRFSLYGIKAGA